MNNAVSPVWVWVCACPCAGITEQTKWCTMRGLQRVVAPKGLIARAPARREISSTSLFSLPAHSSLFLIRLLHVMPSAGGYNNNILKTKPTCCVCSAHLVFLFYDRCSRHRPVRIEISLRLIPPSFLDSSIFSAPVKIQLSTYKERSKRVKYDFGRLPTVGPIAGRPAEIVLYVRLVELEPAKWVHLEETCCQVGMLSSEPNCGVLRTVKVR